MNFQSNQNFYQHLSLDLTKSAGLFIITHNKFIITSLEWALYPTSEYCFKPFSLFLWSAWFLTLSQYYFRPSPLFSNLKTSRFNLSTLNKWACRVIQRENRKDTQLWKFHWLLITISINLPVSIPTLSYNPPVPKSFSLTKNKSLLQVECIPFPPSKESYSWLLSSHSHKSPLSTETFPWTFTRMWLRFSHLKKQKQTKPQKAPWFQFSTFRSSPSEPIFSKQLYILCFHSFSHSFLNLFQLVLEPSSRLLLENRIYTRTLGFNYHLYANGYQMYTSG